MNNTGQVVGGQTGVAGADISAVQAWDVSTGSNSIVVGVIDTGVDYNHPDLSANIWSAPASFSVTVGGRTITCAAGTHGYNAVTNTCTPLDDNNHGTHVSGTIGARGNNSSGVVGVNWTTSIMGLKFLNSSGSGNTADAIECIQFAVQAKQRFGASANVRILSNSWGGGGFSQALLDAINSANSNNMLFVAAAGNANSNNDSVANYPSNYNAANVLAVAATDNRDARSSFSNFGATTVDLGAPGTGIVSTIRNGGFASFSGTSMATPHVSGAAALVLSRCSSLTTAQLKANLMNNVDPVSSLAGRTVTGGRLNVDRAIRACM
jgi:subtilisin family serine protease